MPSVTPSALTIAGSDPSGGAGLQADLKTFQQHAVYGMSAITLVTVQNTRAVSRVDVLEANFVRAQIDAVLSDIPPSAIKVGALGGAAVVRAVSDALMQSDAAVVIDPVMISKHGAPLLDDEAQREIQKLLPCADVITPNAPEAAVLTGRRVEDLGDAEDAARAIADLGAKAVLLKGGHFPGAEATDLLLVDGVVHRFSAPRIETRHTHGTGCTYAAAIAARLALGHALVDAVHGAKLWLQRAIAQAPGLGGGQGPVDHGAQLEGTFPPFQGS